MTNQKLYPYWNRSQHDICELLDGFRKKNERIIQVVTLPKNPMSKIDPPPIDVQEEMKSKMDIIIITEPQER